LLVIVGRPIYGTNRSSGGRTVERVVSVPSGTIEGPAGVLVLLAENPGIGLSTLERTTRCSCGHERKEVVTTEIVRMDRKYTKISEAAGQNNSETLNLDPAEDARECGCRGGSLHITTKILHQQGHLVLRLDQPMERDTG